MTRLQIIAPAFARELTPRLWSSLPGLVIVLAAILLALSSLAEKAGSRCQEDVCIQLNLPPHAVEIEVGKAGTSKLEYVIFLPQKSSQALTVWVFLLRETSPGEFEPAWKQKERMQKGVSWKRGSIDLRKLPKQEPGRFSLGASMSLPSSQKAPQAASYRMERMFRVRWMERR